MIASVWGVGDDCDVHLFCQSVWKAVFRVTVSSSTCWRVAILTHCFRFLVLISCESFVLQAILAWFQRKVHWCGFRSWGNLGSLLRCSWVHWWHAFDRAGVLFGGAGEWYYWRIEFPGYCVLRFYPHPTSLSRTNQQPSNRQEQSEVHDHRQGLLISTLNHWIDLDIHQSQKSLPGAWHANQQPTQIFFSAPFTLSWVKEVNAPLLNTLITQKYQVYKFHCVLCCFLTLKF